MFNQTNINRYRSQSIFLILLTFALSLVTSCGKEAHDTEAPVTPVEKEKNEAAKQEAREETSANTEAEDDTEDDTGGDTDPQLPLMLQPGEGVLSSNGSFRARIKAWITGPQVTQNDDTRNALSIEFASESGAKPLSFEALQVIPYMKIHGHGVPRAYLPLWSVEDNTLIITRLGFIMAGPWQIIVQARVNGIEDRIEIPVEVP